MVPDARIQAVSVRPEEPGVENVHERQAPLVCGELAPGPLGAVAGVQPFGFSWPMPGVDMTAFHEVTSDVQ